MTDSSVLPPEAHDPDDSSVGAARRRVPLVLKVFGGFVSVLVLAAVTAAFVQVPYYLLSPGAARPTEALISVEGAESFQHPGEVEFATVSLQRATAMQALMGWIDPTVEVVDEDIILGTNTREENRQVNLEQMTGSKQVATAVALDSLGYDVTTTGTGATVIRVEAGSPADGKLAPADVVVGADGQTVTLNDQLVTIIQSHRPGDQLQLQVEVGGTGDPVPVDVVLGAAPDDPERGFLGVATGTRGLSYQFPFEVTIDSGDVGGPSAGLAFTLGIIDTLSPESITGGHRVATTGTMSPDGSVGAVGGVPQKTVAVRRSGAELFLVPSSEYDQAKEFAGDMTIVSVDTLDQALAALEDFRVEVQGES